MDIIDKFKLGGREMIECSVNNLTKYYGASKVFENISFELKSRERLGLIGRNGCGKTSLMKTIIGEEPYESGTISIRKGSRLGYLDQIFEFPRGTRVIDVLELAFEDVWEIKKKMRLMEKEMREAKDSTQLTQAYGRLMEEYELRGGYEVDMSIDRVCEGLMIHDSFREREFEGLSGGEKTRVMLAKLLLEEPDILLMDEPTNHLDIRSIEWLEDFLRDYKGAVLIISHDRVFLDRVVTRIIELEPRKANVYHGNYSYYLEEKERRFELEYKAYLNQQKKIDEMERQIERYRIWGAMRDSDKMYVRAKELEKRLEKIDELDRPSIDSRKIRLGAEGIARTGKQVLLVEDLSKSFGDKRLFSAVDFNIFYRDRVCIMGENGSGKTSLLRLILGELEADSGKIRLGSNVRLGYLPQNVEFEDSDKDILTYFMDEHNLTIGEARSELAKVLFIQDDVFKKISSLSGGEKSRLKLISLLYNKVNFLVLDEPTNHLDIDSREVLEDTLVNYEGTILFVSHDRYFVEKVAEKMLILEGGSIVEYNMGYLDYVERLEKEAPRELPEKKPEKKKNKRPRRKKDRTQKIERLELEIGELEEAIESMDLKMEESARDPEKLNELFLEKAGLEKNLDSLIHEWSSILDGED